MTLGPHCQFIRSSEYQNLISVHVKYINSEMTVICSCFTKRAGCPAPGAVAGGHVTGFENDL